MKRNTRSITESPSLENADELKNTIADAIVTMMVEDMPVHEIVTGSLEMVRESLETPELETVPGSEFAGMVADDVLEILMNSYEFREDIKNVAMGVLRGLSKPTRPEAPSGFAYGDEGKQDK
jgi:hypothetical protein